MKHTWCGLLVLGVVWPGTTRGAEAIVKTGDVLVLSGRRMMAGHGQLVPDTGAPGGQAVQSKGKGTYVVSARTPLVSAGRYRVTVRLAVLRRTTAQHVGRIIVGTVPGRHVEDLSLPVGTEDFAGANKYRDLSLELVRGPADKGRMHILTRVNGENAKMAVRVASVTVRALAIAPVLVHKVWPEKLLARCNAPQPITVSVSNITDQAQGGLKLKLELAHGLAGVVAVGVKDVALEPYASAEVRFDWNTGTREYGYEARATLTDAAGKTVSTCSDYFAVSRSHFKLRIHGSAQRGGWYTDKNGMLFGARSMRQTYGNYVEVYGWSPSAFVELYPRHRFWTSGQVCAWQFDRDVMKAWIDEMHRLGLWVTAYNISLYTGWPGLEIMRRHPEWCAFNKLGRPAGGVNTALWKTRATAYGDTKLPPRPTFTGEMPNHGSVWPMNDDLMRHGANEIVLIHQKLGFDGVRWDGHPIVYVTKKEGSIKGTDFGKMVWNHEGKRIVDVVPDGDLDRQSLHNIRLIKEAVRKVAPAFEWGYNAGYDLTAEQQPRTWKEVATNAGIWVEGGFRSADEGRANPTNTWLKYINKLYLSCQFVIRSGGYPIHGALAADSKIVRRFMSGIFLAQGSHVCWHGGSWGEFLDHCRFATRYSQYLFDPRIHPWWGYPDIHVTGWVQWEDRKAGQVPPLGTEAKITSARPLFFPDKMLFHREVSATRKDTILHLFNHPGKPYVDYTQIDAPPVQENLVVRLKIPKGMTAREAWCLSPDRWPMSEKLEVQPAEPGWIKLTVPRLESWDIVVVAWTKEG